MPLPAAGPAGTKDDAPRPDSPTYGATMLFRLLSVLGVCGMLLLTTTTASRGQGKMSADEIKFRLDAAEKEAMTPGGDKAIQAMTKMLQHEGGQERAEKVVFHLKQTRPELYSRAVEVYASKVPAAKVPDGMVKEYINVLVMRTQGKATFGTSFIHEVGLLGPRASDAEAALTQIASTPSLSESLRNAALTTVTKIKKK